MNAPVTDRSEQLTQKLNEQPKEQTDMSVFSHPEFDNHEQLTFFSDEKSGLKAIIAVHNTNLGPALGGCRMWHYASDEEALRDVLRLSRGMTYKSAPAQVRGAAGDDGALPGAHRRSSTSSAVTT